MQRACCDWLAIQERMGRLRYFAVPNGGRRGRVEAARLKGLGVRSGIPDLVILFDGGTSLFCELKSPKGRLSFVQKIWAESLNSMGFHWAEVRSLDDLRGAVKRVRPS